MSGSLHQKAIVATLRCDAQIARSIAGFFGEFDDACVVAIEELLADPPIATSEIERSIRASFELCEDKEAVAEKIAGNVWPVNQKQLNCMLRILPEALVIRRSDLVELMATADGPNGFYLDCEKHMPGITEEIVEALNANDALLEMDDEALLRKLRDIFSFIRENTHGLRPAIMQKYVACELIHWQKVHGGTEEAFNGIPLASLDRRRLKLAVESACTQLALGNNFNSAANVAVTTGQSKLAIQMASFAYLQYNDRQQYKEAAMLCKKYSIVDVCGTAKKALDVLCKKDMHKAIKWAVEYELKLSGERVLAYLEKSYVNSDWLLMVCDNETFKKAVFKMCQGANKEVEEFLGFYHQPGRFTPDEAIEQLGEIAGMEHKDDDGRIAAYVMNRLPGLGLLRYKREIGAGAVRAMMWWQQRSFIEEFGQQHELLTPNSSMVDQEAAKALEKSDWSAYLNICREWNLKSRLGEIRMTRLSLGDKEKPKLGAFNDLRYLFESELPEEPQ